MGDHTSPPVWFTCVPYLQDESTGAHSLSNRQDGKVSDSYKRVANFPSLIWRATTLQPAISPDRRRQNEWRARNLQSEKSRFTDTFACWEKWEEEKEPSWGFVFLFEAVAMSIQTAFPVVVLPSLTPATSSRRRPRRLVVRAKGPFFCGFVMLNAFMWMSFRLLYFLLDSTGNFRELKD